MACTGCPAMGVFTKVLLEDGVAPYTFDADSKRLEILDEEGENLQKHGRIIGGQGITGLFYRLKTRKRFGGYFVYGRFTMNPSPAYFEILLPYLLGAKEEGVFTPTACLLPFGMMVDRDYGNPWELQEGIVSGWELSAEGISFQEQGQPDLLKLHVDVVFKDEARTATWPTISPPVGTGTDYYPYIFQDSVFTLNESPREVYQFSLRYSNMLSIRYANSLTRSSACSTGRQLQLGVVVPWNATNANLYDQSYIGATAQIKFTLGSHSTQFDLTNLTVPPQSPYTRNRAEIWFENNGEGYGDETTDTPELTVTNTIGE